MDNNNNDSAPNGVDSNFNLGNEEVVNGDDNDIEPCSSGEAKPNRKSVHFVSDVNLHLLDGPCATDMSSEEKQITWYNSNEYDQFKYEAAKNAGVKIVRYDTEMVGRRHHFVMTGDFDCQYNREDASSASTKNATNPYDNGAKKFHYNENEYNDSHNENGVAVCKRGLGYHFSRSRKRSKIANRSAVLAWQEALRDPADRSDLASRSAPGKNPNESRAALALVSAERSRVPREEARWRGGVDYEVAYPERRGSSLAHSRREESDPTRDSASDGGTAARKKRPRDDADVISRTYYTGCTRQRTDSGGYHGDRCELSRQQLPLDASVRRFEQRYRLGSY